MARTAACVTKSARESTENVNGQVRIELYRSHQEGSRGVSVSPTRTKPWARLETDGVRSRIAFLPGKRGKSELRARKPEILEFTRPQQKEPESGAAANQACDEQEVESGKEL